VGSDCSSKGENEERERGEREREERERERERRETEKERERRQREKERERRDRERETKKREERESKREVPRLQRREAHNWELNNSFTSSASASLNAGMRRENASCPSSASKLRCICRGTVSRGHEHTKERARHTLKIGSGK
jgi:RNA-binding protein 39